MKKVTETINIEEITPTLAEKYLTANTHNRTLKEKVVQRYAAMMQADQWDLNGESIKFDVNGVLLDGQHRLWAVLESQKTIKTYVVRGLAPEVMETIDTGARRLASDLLQIEGITNATTVAAASRLVYSYYDGQWGTLEKGLNSAISNREVVDTVNSHPKLIDSVEFCNQYTNKLRAFCSVSLAGAMHYILRRISAEKCDAFFEAFIHGANLEPEDAVLSLRNSLYRIKGQAREERLLRTALIIKAWNLFIRGKNSKVLTWRPYEEFPKIDSPEKLRKKA